MAMTDEGLSAAIKSSIEQILQGNILSDDRLQQFCDALGKAIVEYVKANAVVSTPGVQSGGSTKTGSIS